MKYIIAVLAFVLVLAEPGYPQSVNWRSLRPDQRHLIQLDLGYSYGATAQFGYGYRLTLVRPAMVGIDYSFPMGERLLDDFKVRLGAQIEILEVGGFSATARILASLRRFENPLVRIVGFGSDFGLVAGYYDPAWHVAGELGFDKAITSHVEHSDVMRTSFPAARDGWYIPTGGNWYYGLQAGKTIGESYDLSVRMGATDAQGSDEDAVLAYYLQLGLGMRF